MSIVSNTPLRIRFKNISRGAQITDHHFLSGRYKNRISGGNCNRNLKVTRTPRSVRLIRLLV